MTSQEKEFVDYWGERRKKWNWKNHSYQTFIRIVLPIAVAIDLTNYFVVGDTEYSFFSFSHLFSFIKILLLISVFIILAGGFISWNLNENRYWKILRKNTDKLQ